MQRIAKRSFEQWPQRRVHENLDEKLCMNINYDAKSLDFIVRIHTVRNNATHYIYYQILSKKLYVRVFIASVRSPRPPASFQMGTGGQRWAWAHSLYPITKYPMDRPESQINSNNVHINKNNVISCILYWVIWPTKIQPTSEFVFVGTRATVPIQKGKPYASSIRTRINANHLKIRMAYKGIYR